MDIQSSYQGYALERAPRSSTQEAASVSPASDFTTFLKLLTSQLRNQDPMQPLDSTDFVAQLASFSAVEQQVRSNELLSGLYQLMSADDAQKLTSWIGKDVRAAVDPHFKGDPIDVFVDLPDGADKAQLVVTDNKGRVVQKIKLPLDQDSYRWDGKLKDGTTLAEGDYKLTIESSNGDEPLETVQPSIYGRVTETRLDNGSVLLVLANGTKVPADLVSAIREPS